MLSFFLYIIVAILITICILWNDGLFDEQNSKLLFIHLFPISMVGITWALWLPFMIVILILFAIVRI